MPDSAAADGAATRRLFFALWPDAAVADALQALAIAERARCGGRAMRSETLHLTLAFLGDVSADRVAAAEAVAGEVHGEAFELALDRLGFWRHNRICWAGCAAPPAALGELAADLAQRLRVAGFRLEKRAFAAHVTLLRHAERGDDGSRVPAIVWCNRDFALVESCRDRPGAHYRVVRRWPLHGNGA